MPKGEFLRLAARQHGIFSVQQAKDAGITKNRLAYMVAQHEASRLFPGVYRLEAAPRTFRQFLMGAHVWAGPGSAFSHRTAGRLLGLCDCDLCVDLTTTRTLRSPDPRIMLFRRPPLPAMDLTRVNGLPVTTPAHLIDINHLADEPLDLEVDDGVLAFGPLVRQETAMRSRQLAEKAPLIAEAMNYVAHPAIRSRGTVVGSVAHADPSAELPAVLVVLEGEVVARGAAGTRSIPAAEFFVGPLENSLGPGEWATEVRFPTRDPTAGYAFEEFARRRGDYALCGVAAVSTRGGDGRVDLALSYLGVGDAPVRLTAASIGEGEIGDAVAELVVDNLDPPDDIHATSEFRAHLARKLGERASRRALDAIPEGK